MMETEAGKKPKIIVVENDRIQRDLILLALRRLNCDVIILQNGLDVVTAIQSQKPEVVILDLFLPLVSGLDILEELKQSGMLVKTTVIVVSGMGFTEIVEQAKEKGAFDFLIKPIETDLLVNRVEKALRRRDK